MVWEKNIHVIVMITKCVELGKRKCAQYWPETTDPEGVRHGHVTIQLTKTVNTEGYDVHHLKVSSGVSTQRVAFKAVSISITTYYIMYVLNTGC